jgi:two-component sensor histidine kinase
VKYGSLSESGHVEITWSSELIDDQPSFRFLWNESGGPDVTEPAPGKKGFGSRLIERMLASDFAGKVNTFYRRSGVACELIAPLSALTQPEQHPEPYPL